MKTELNKEIGHIIAALIVTSFLVTSCSSKINKAINIADSAELTSTVIKTSTFKIQAFYRIKKTGSPLNIYIEGDGRAWLNRNNPSANPTPNNPIALRLASIDKNKNVIYLARPCQYVDLSNEEHCDVPYWTQKRFARPVIIAINEAINILSTRAKSKDIHLIGYSGGGAIVAMIAAIRKDIASIRTVAGYMDHVSLNRNTNVSQLTGSLDPMKAAPRLKSVPQIHYSGRKDKRVPGWVLLNFKKAVGNGNCVKLKKVNASHETGWEDIWERVWAKIPTCRK
jgi:hypothetical protein